MLSDQPICLFRAADGERSCHGEYLSCRPIFLRIFQQCLALVVVPDRHYNHLNLSRERQ